MVASAIAMLVVAAFPWVIAGLCALICVLGSESAPSDAPVASSYQPMRLLTTR